MADDAPPLFGTAGIRGTARDRVTPELALRVGRAVGDSGRDVVVARDGRTTGPALSAAVAAGLTSAGARVLRAGQVPTPTLAFASRGRYGVMLTASHNPPADNGIKLFADGVEYDREAERAVEERVAAGPAPASWDAWGDVEQVAVVDDYRAAVVDYVGGHGADPTGLSVAVDCGNGTGALSTPQVLRELGADVTALNASVDGHFPGRPSKPTPETLGDLRAFVRDGDADLGLAHDGDADRLVVVGPDGDVVHEDTVLSVVAAHYVRASDAADPVVVTTPNASARVDEQVAAAGGRVERVRLGALHEGVADARLAGADVVFAAEPWKHLHPAFGGWIDGVVSAALLVRLTAAAGGVDALRDPVTERPYRKVSVACPEARKDAALDCLAERLPAKFPEASVDTSHGVRLDFGGDWVLVRPSGTEPKVRVYAESEDVDALVDRVVETVEFCVAD